MQVNLILGSGKYHIIGELCSEASENEHYYLRRS